MFDDRPTVDRTGDERANRSRYAAIMFDLDGTLTDPRIGITRSVQHALRRYGIDVVDLDTLLPFIGPPLIESFERYYGFGHEQAKEAVGVYREYFGTIGLYENALYPGIPQLLRDLRETGRSLAVASSKATVYVERILGHFEIASLFDLVAGSNLDHTRVAKHEVIAHVLETDRRFNVGQTVMVGDRMHDIVGARHHGIDGIGVSYGYGTEAELRDAGAIAIASSVPELELLLHS